MQLWMPNGTSRLVTDCVAWKQGTDKLLISESYISWNLSSTSAVVDIISVFSFLVWNFKITFDHFNYCRTLLYFSVNKEIEGSLRYAIRYEVSKILLEIFKVYYDPGSATKCNTNYRGLFCNETFSCEQSLSPRAQSRYECLVWSLELATPASWQLDPR